MSAAAACSPTAAILHTLWASAPPALQLSRDTGISAGKPLKLRYAWPRSRVRPAGGGGAFLSSQPSGASSIAGSISGSAPEVMSEPRCDACGVPAAVVPLKRCSGCKAVLVCSAECQQLSWQAGHHEDCAQLARLGEALGGDDVTPATLKLLAAALQRPAAREGRMLQAVLAQQAAAAAQ